MPTIALCIWTAAIACKSLAAVRLRPQFRLFPFLWLFIAASVLRSAALLTNPSHYRLIAARTAPILIGLEVAAAIGIFWRLTESYPRWRKPGLLLLAVITTIGASGAWLLRSVGIPADWSAPWQLAYVLQRHWMVGLCIGLLVMRRLLQHFGGGLPVRPIVARAAECLAVDVALGALSAALVMQAGAVTPAWAYSVGPMAGIVNGLLWAIWLPMASAEIAPRSVATREERERYLALSRLAVRGLRGCIPALTREARRPALR